jgi:hypothetical protein
MKCKAVLREIEELEQGARLSVETDAHLSACESCSAFARERDALRQLLAGLDAVETPPDFDWRLRARLAEARSEGEPARNWLSGFAPGARALTVAASVMLLLATVIIYRQATQRPAMVTESSRVAVTNIKEDVKNEGAAPQTVNQQADAQALNSGNELDNARSQTPRTRNAKSPKANTRTDVAGQSTQPTQRILSNDSASRAAPEFTLAELQSSAGNAGPVISVRMPQPRVTELRLEDGQGNKRTLAPVNFGGQELIERPEKARLVPTSEKGIW